MPTTLPAGPFRASVTIPPVAVDREAYQFAHQEASPALDSRWYALRTRSKAEFAVSAALRAKGVDEFLPYKVEQVRWSDRIKSVTRPLFTGYIFARFARFAEASRVLETHGVISILGSNELSSISTDVIADLQRVVSSPVAVTLSAYVAGVTVRVRRGPWAGVSGVVQRTKGTSLLWIPVYVLQRWVSVPINAADVEKDK
jgi:transcription antitermination factor NusG